MAGILGLAWGALLITAVALGPAASAALLIPIGVVASVSSVRAASSTKRGRTKARRRNRAAVLAVGVAVAVPLVAIAGPIAALVVVLLAAAGAAFVLVSEPKGPPLFASLAAVFAPVVAIAAVVVAAGQGTSKALALVISICLYDLACFVMGNGRTPLGGPVGVISGMVTVGVFAVLVAAAMDPPFSGVRTWIMFGTLVALAPASVALAGRLVPGGTLPAFRRIDSLLLAGPAWVVAAAILLHH